MRKKDSAIINEIDKARLKLSIEHYIKYFIGKRTCEVNRDEALNAIALAVREFAMDKMYETIARYNRVNSKRIYYLSVEYLIGAFAGKQPAQSRFVPYYEKYQNRRFSGH